MPRKPRTPAPSAPLPDAVTLAEAVADVDALFGVQPEAEPVAEVKPIAPDAPIGYRDPLDYLTPAECHAVYRAVQSGRIRIAEWTGRALQTVTGSLIGNVYALPNGGYAGRTGGRIEEFATEAEARAAVEGHAAEAGWTVTR